MSYSPEDYDYCSTKYKLILLGDCGVGKTSIVNRFAYDKYNYKYEQTVGVDFLSKRVNIKKRSVHLQVWDTAGQEQFRSLIPSYIKGSHVAVIVYDITNHNTFESTKHWINEAKQVRDNDLILALVGNKNDLNELRKVDTNEGMERAKEYNALFVETSAENGFNIDKLFEEITRVLPKIESNEGLLLSHEKSGQIGSERNEYSIERSDRHFRCKC